jgi:hypothetical protein
MAAADLTPDVVAALPPIPGFEDVPFAPPGPEPPPLTDANYNLWSVELDDVITEHVRQVWIHTVRADGDMLVRGRWVFRPTRWLEVGPATVVVDAVDVSHGGRRVFTGLHGSFDATIHPFDVRTADGLHFFDYVSTEMRLSGLLDWSAAAIAIMPPSDVLFARGEGPLEMQLTLDHGVLAPGTRVSVEAKDSEIDGYDMTLNAQARAEIDVEQGVEHPAFAGAIHGRVSEVRVSRRGAEQARARAIEATLTTRHLDVADAFNDALFALDVHGAETGDLEAWTRLFPKMPEGAFRSGVVAADAHADGSLPEKHLEGKAKVVADSPVVHLGRASVTGKVVADVVVPRWAWADHVVDLSGSGVTLRDVSAGSSMSPPLRSKPRT